MTNFNLSPIENEGKRVLTTAQIADYYETTEKRISENFTRNEERYIEGKHFYCLTGDELKAFKNLTANCGVVDKRTPILYLWTEKGALLHAKSLNTDKAWEVYDFLVENYFRIQEIKQLSPIEMIATIANNAVEIEKRQKTLEIRQQDIEERTEKVLDVFTTSTDTAWHKAIMNQFKKICYDNNLNYHTTLGNLYRQLENEVSCSLSSRQRNKQKRMKAAGYTSALITKETSKIMLIEDDDALRLAFENIFRQFQVRYINN
ncbi:MAG: ORF6N domain-containing protein [Ruminococcus sp.]|nr:ORF6N domain-containing protein [Ruminococcus sp.]